jgi:N utilization substance protein B
MLNRRLIRSKVFQAFYAYSQTENASLRQSLNYLNDSLKGVRKNFLVYLHFPLEFIHFTRQEMAPDSTKYLPNEADRTHHKLLSLEGLYESMMENKELSLYIEKPYMRWQNEKELLRQVYKETKESKFYKKFASSEQSLKDQIAFLKDFYEYLAFDQEEFGQSMEEHEMHWEDERIPIFNAVRKVLDKFEETGEFKLPALSKNVDEDIAFAEQLLKKAIARSDDFEELIDNNTPGWDKDRIARTDLLLMIAALTEFVEFPYVPIKVSLNEYLELAKVYSTPQSSKFLNGILDKLIVVLKEQGMIAKKGRGLIE